MSRLGFYGWVRENVKRAVLLGVSDAVDAIGTVDERDELHPQLANVLRESAPRIAAGKRPTEQPRTEGRKRLGRSLAELQAPPPAAKPA